MGLKVNIYVLIDPITCKIRYIGRTKNRLEIRLRGHMSKCLHKKTHKDCWLYGLRSRGLKPKIKLVRVVSGWEYSHKYERNLIKKCLDFGFNLVNLDDKGVGGINKLSSPEQRLKISNTLKEGYLSGRIIATNKSKVIVYDLFGNILFNFETQKECAEKLGVHISTIETQVSGLVRRCGKYQIRSIKQPNPGVYKLTRDMSFNFKSVKVLNLDSNEELIFRSYGDAAKALSVSSPTIKRKIESGDLLKNKYSICLNVKKSDKLLENPEEDNQQPIISLND